LISSCPRSATDINILETAKVQAPTSLYAQVPPHQQDLQQQKNQAPNTTSSLIPEAKVERVPEHQQNLQRQKNVSETN